MKILLITAAVIIIIMAVSYLCFKKACVRQHRSRNIEKIYKNLTKPYGAVLAEGLEYIESKSFEEAQIVSHDGLKLYARIYHAENPKGTVILAHGYRSSAKKDFCAAFSRYGENFDMLVINQRACGKSEGKYIGFGVLERHDLLRWAQFADEKMPHPIYISGISMGATTALMATELDLPSSVKGVIADCGFTAPNEIIAHVMKRDYHAPAFPMLYIMNMWSKLLAGYDFFECSTVDAVKKSKIPIAFLHGKEDAFVPCHMSIEAYEACISPKKIIVVEGARHGTSWLVDREGCNQVIEWLLMQGRDKI